jgi:hypothetical protein
VQDLCTSLTEASRSLFIMGANPSLTSLHSIYMHIDQEMLPFLPALLSKTPALRSLKLFPTDPDTPQNMSAVEAPTTCPIPYLEEYRGPHTHLPILLGMGSPSASLRRLFLESVVETGDHLDSFISSFQSYHPLQLSALTHLHIALLESVDLKSLAKLQDMFPVLEVFNLHAAEYDRPGLSCEFSQISLSI